MEVLLQKDTILFTLFASRLTRENKVMYGFNPSSRIQYALHSLVFLWTLNQNLVILTSQ